GKFKWPKLEELYQKLFNEKFEEAHNAAADVVATTRCFFELIRLNVITAERLKQGANYTQLFRNANPNVIQPIEIEIISLHVASKELELSLQAEKIETET